MLREVSPVCVDRHEPAVLLVDRQVMVIVFRPFHRGVDLAVQLPQIAEAQARYGVALVLAGEQNLGRQFLQTALRLGSLDSQYQLWAAWTILQAGYPEEADPIVSALLRQVANGDAPRELAAARTRIDAEQERLIV